MSTFALHNLTPARVVAPATAEELADCLRDAATAGLAVVPWGGGTRQHIGRPPARYDIALSTARLAQIVEHTPADLTITVEAGTTLAAIQATLADHGQWLPWDPPLPATAGVGGLLASAAAGPLRLGYGPPRDWTLGMRVALGDGRLVRSGARVVKNVAGYDAHKLHIGALGTLGVIAEVTFKVAPLPQRRQTLLASFMDPRLSLQAADELRAAPLQPIALVALNDLAEQATPGLHDFLAGQPTHIVLAARFAGAPGAVGRQLREAARRCVEAGARTIEISEEDDAALWAAIADFTAPTGSLLLRAGAPAGAMGDLARLLDVDAHRRGWAMPRMILPGVGLGYSRLPAGPDANELRAALAELRAGVAALGGYVVVEQAPAGLAGELDLWGPPPEAARLMRALRAAWDPAGVLNPGRYAI